MHTPDEPRPRQRAQVRTTLSRPVLHYQGPNQQPRTYSPTTAALLALPGATCWCIFLNALGIGPRFGSDVFGSDRVESGFLFLLWALAVATAVASLVEFGGRAGEPKPWYVILCLLINITGLLFTAVAVAFMLLLLA